VQRPLQEKKNRRQPHRAFTPSLFQAKLPPVMALPPTMGTRPIRTHTPVPAVLPRAPDEPSPFGRLRHPLCKPFAYRSATPPTHMPGLTDPRGNSPVLKAFARAHLRLTGSPKNCPNTQPSRLRNIWCRLPVVYIHDSLIPAIPYTYLRRSGTEGNPGRMS
jgi:hypothetical protein